MTFASAAAQRVAEPIAKLVELLVAGQLKAVRQLVAKLVGVEAPKIVGQQPAEVFGQQLVELVTQIPQSIEALLPEVSEVLEADAELAERCEHVGQARVPGQGLEEVDRDRHRGVLGDEARQVGNRPREPALALRVVDGAHQGGANRILHAALVD